MAERRVSVGIDADVSAFVRGLGTAAAATKGFAHELESADGRMANLVQTGLALAPALVPIGAAAVPAVAGLTLQLGLAAAAAGTAVLAFHGIGDAMKALDTYRLKPTAENFAKLTAELDKLGPAGQEFVFFLEDLKPKLQGVQDLAEQGLLPGVEDGLNHLLTLLPQVKDVVFTIASTMGDLTSQAGAGIANSATFQDFFTYVDTTARPVLTEMGKTVAAVADGFAHLIMAFDPLSRDFSTGLLHMAQAFDQWAAGVARTQGFRDFVDYIQTNLPRVVETLGAVGNALVQLVEAAAPVGPVALAGIRGLADALAAIADSPVGPILISAAAAVGVLGRSLALLKTVGLAGGGESVISRSLGVSKIKGAIAAIREAKVATEDLTAAQKANYEAGIGARAASPAKGAISAYIGSQQQVAKASEAVREAEEKKAVAIREGAAAAGKAVALAGGLALATSGLADKTGLANTMTLALMGTIAGPWGVAIGGGVGLVKDFSAANNDLESAMKAVDAAARSQALNFAAQGTALSNLRSQADAYNATIAKSHSATNFDIGANITAFADMFTHSSSEAQSAIDRQTQSLLQMGQAAGEVYAALNHGDTSKIGASFDQLQKVVDDITPALQRAGINVKAFLQSASGSDLRLEGLKAIRSYFDEMASASGKSKAVGDALKGLASQMTDTQSAADALKTAMDSLFGVQLSQSEATDAWTQGLRDLRKAIAGTNGAILGQSKAALTNRDAIRTSVQQLEAKVNADAAAGASGRKLVNSLIDGRKAIIEQGVAAGASRKQMRAYLDTLGLTPKNLTTIIKADGALTARQQVEALGKAYGLTPKEVRTLMSQPGMPQARAMIDDLAKKYHLTPKEVSTLIKAVDEAGPVIGRVRIELDGLDGRVAHTYVVTTHRDVRVGGGSGIAANPTLNAGGGYIRGPGTTTSDSIPALLSDREYVIRAAAVDRYGVEFFDRLNAMTFAQGGQVQRFAGGGPVQHFASGGLSHRDREMRELTRELRNLTGELKKARDDRKQYKQTVSQAFISDPFGGTLGGFEGQLRYEAGKLRGTKADLATLRARHIDPSLLSGLAASGNSTLIDQFAHLSRSQLAAEAAQFRMVNRLDRQVGTSAAEGVYRSQITHLTHEVNGLTRELHALRHGKHIGNTNFNGRVTIRDSESKAKTKRAAQKVRHG